jgi:hypothetical protein
MATLAMAHAQLGAHDEAREWYQKAKRSSAHWAPVNSIEVDNLRRLRSRLHEAERLLGMTDEASPREADASGQPVMPAGAEQAGPPDDE